VISSSYASFALPDKTNSALVIDPNAELPVSIPLALFSGDFLAVAFDRKDQFAAPNLASFRRVIAAGGELVVLPLHQIDDVHLSSNHWITKKCANEYG
jgi:hypothetical protein